MHAGAVDRAAKQFLELNQPVALVEVQTAKYFMLEIAQAICDRVVILHGGHVLASGTVAALRDRTGLAGRDLEEVFLSLTGTGDLRDVVDALSR